MAKSTESAKRVAELVRKLRDDIKFGAYDLGERLKLSRLQDAYGYSQSEVRRALAELARMKLVEHQHNSGFSVAEQDRTEREQLRYVRTVLERSAVALITARSTPQDIEDLRRLAEAFARTIREHGRQQQAAANIAFHHRLYEISGNDLLLGLIDDLREQSHYGTTGRWRTIEGLCESSDEHFAMIDAIKRRDPAELDRLIMLHIRAF